MGEVNRMVKFSLIMATIGRYEVVRSFLESIENIDYEKDLIEIIIVDQNTEIDLSSIIKDFSHLNIQHIKSSIKGLSQNRNIGLAECTGDVVAFPDDDCEYLEDTLKNVVEAFKKDEEATIIMGRIVQKDGSDSLRTWPKEHIKITKSNFYTKGSSITMFIKKSDVNLRFDENLGAGNYFGACEDSDMLYRHLKAKKKVHYTPKLRLYHPHEHYSSSDISKTKVRNYGRGFGAFCKINMDFNTFLLFIEAEAYHALNMLIGIVTFNKKRLLKAAIAFSSRIEGFFKYKAC